MRGQLIEIGRLMHSRNMLAAADGNLSVRLDRDRILITPSGLSKAFLSQDQLLIVDMEGNKTSVNAGPARDLVPSSEARMHLECYRRRPDVQAVIHAHPPYAIACTLAGLSLAKCTLPEVVYDLGTIPTAPYATPASEENPRAIRDLIGQFDALLLERHGSLTVGGSPWEAYFRLERVEHSAQVTLLANTIQRVQPLSDEAVAKLAGLRRSVFAQRGRDICAECNACAVSERHASREGGASFAPSGVRQLELIVAEEVQRSLGK